MFLFRREIKSPGVCFGINATLFCGNLYRYVGVFNEAKTTFLVVFGNDKNRQNPLWRFRTFD